MEGDFWPRGLQWFWVQDEFFQSWERNTKLRQVDLRDLEGMIMLQFKAGKLLE